MKKNSDDIVKFLKEINPSARHIFMTPIDCVFEENVKMNCFYCGKYANNWKCPPNLPNIDYKKMFAEFNHGMFVILEYYFSDNAKRDEARRESSVTLHKNLLSIEKFLLENNHSTVLSFGAGSCKLCKNGCGKDGCNNPYLARSPLEATGCNVVKTLKKYGVNITFPATNHLLRIGLVLWQD